MAVKFNKEMIIKHRFWIMLGTAVTLTLVGILCLEFVSAEETINQVKTTIASVSKLNKSIPNDAAINALASEAKKASDSESKVWSKAYAAQESLYMWAPEVEEKYHFYDGLFATDIKLAKGTDAKAWPKDTTDGKVWPKDTPTLLVHGTVEKQGPISFVLKTRAGDLLTFYATPGVDNIAVTDEKDKKPIFAELLKYSTGRYAAVTFQRGRYFGDMLTPAERSTFAGGIPKIKDDRASSSYKAQIRPILKLVDPLDDQGNGVVQLKGWLFKAEKPDDADGLPHEDPAADGQRFINYVKVPWNTGIDFSKGAWIAQEDLWIQKEIYRIIGETNNTVSLFELQKGNENDKVKVFKNSYFELHLALLPDGSISFTAKNLLNRRQRLDQKFLVKTIEKGTPEEIKISADPLMPKGDSGKKDSYTEIRPAPKDGTVRKGIFEVRQVLTWETAAVKRIDQISIGSNASGDIAHGHRTYTEGLFPFLTADIGAPDDPTGSSTPGGAIPGPSGPKPGLNKGKGSGPKGPGVPRGAQGGAGNAQKIAHDLWLTRYVEVSEQSRRIPVAIALIIDQDHVDRVLTHFNNSKLRFLETQVILNHYPASLQPLAPPDAKGDQNRPAGPAGPGGLFGPKGGAGQGPGAQPGATGGSAEMETNMEIVIYGIMTLYQRYPPRPVVAPPPGAAPAPAAAAPAAPGAPAPPAADKKNER